MSIQIGDKVKIKASGIEGEVALIDGTSLHVDHKNGDGNLIRRTFIFEEIETLEESEGDAGEPEKVVSATDTDQTGKGSALSAATTGGEAGKPAGEPLATNAEDKAVEGTDTQPPSADSVSTAAATDSTLAEAAAQGAAANAVTGSDLSGTEGNDSAPAQAVVPVVATQADAGQASKSDTTQDSTSQSNDNGVSETIVNNAEAAKAQVGEDA